MTCPNCGKEDDPAILMIPHLCESDLKHKLKEILRYLAYEAKEAVEYVGMANYAERQREALKRVERALEFGLVALDELEKKGQV